MNVFEDLIEELREENLLEETVIDLQKEARARACLRNQFYLRSRSRMPT
jgi:hypothetical protein